MNFIKQYLKIINYTLMGLVFGFACFYLLSNAYHYLEIRKDFVTNFDSQKLVTDLKQKISNINTNVSVFNANTYSGSLSTTQMITIGNNLKSCADSLNNSTFQSMAGKQRITIIDVYNLREAYEDDVLNSCIVSNLYWTTDITSDTFNSSYLLDNQELIKLYFNTLLNETSYLKKDLISNSSYFFSTSISTSSVKSNTKDGFYEVMNAYNDAASFVEFMSNWYKNEVEGNYD